MSDRIVEPVVVYPDTLSNSAFTRENSLPTLHTAASRTEKTVSTTGDNHEPRPEGDRLGLLTKMNGSPAMKVIIKLMDRGANAESILSQMEISMEMNMNKALTRSALWLILPLRSSAVSCPLKIFMFPFSSLSFANDASSARCFPPQSRTRRCLSPPVRHLRRRYRCTLLLNFR